jgi:hypothetical protein
MNQMRARQTGFIAALFLTISAFGAAAVAQDDTSTNDLRRQNQALRADLQEKEAELAAAHERIALLEQRIAELEARLAGTPTTRPAPAPAVTPGRPAAGPGGSGAVTIDESIPSASPRALNRALESSYEQAIGPLDRGTPDSRERRNLLREIEHWAAGATRQFRDRITWHVEPVEYRYAGEQLLLVVYAIDPSTRTRLGREFTLAVGHPGQRRRLDREFGDALPETLIVRGTLIPKVAVNPRRETPGMFNQPPLLAPFVEHGFEINIDSIALPPKPRRTPTTQP